MKLLIVATTLLFYTQATETKKICTKYLFTELIMNGYENIKAACEPLNGVIASEDLKDSQNAEKAKVEIKKFREENNNNHIALGITAKDVNRPINENDNHFAFSDGTDFDEGAFAFQWGDDLPSYGGGGEYKCAYLNKDGKLANAYCGYDGHALCAVEEECEDASSGSERSLSANLPVFALFTVGSVIKTFFALVGLSF